MDGFQSMSLVFQLIVELPKFCSSITSLLIDTFAAFITHLLLLLPCVEILTLDNFKEIQQQMYHHETKLSFQQTVVLTPSFSSVLHGD